MKKLILLTLALCCAASLRAQLLWQVSLPEQHRPSYVLGSHHLTPGNYIDSIPGLTDAIAHTDAVIGELNLDNLPSEANLSFLISSLTVPEDSTLSALLTDSELALVDSVLTVCTGVPGTIRLMGRLKPCVLRDQITAMQTSKLFPDFDPGKTFDLQVMQRSASLGKATEGLETLDFQMRLLYSDPLDQQALELVDLCRNLDTLGQDVAVLTEAYLKGDLDQLLQLTTDPEHDGFSPERMESLVYARNRQWADYLAQRLLDSPALVVVGAAHLPGDQGLLQLLRCRGFTVQPAY